MKLWLSGFGITEAAEVTEQKLVSYLTWLTQEGKAATTISRVIASMKLFFSYELKQGLISSNPAENLKAPKVEKKAPTVLTGQEIEAPANAIGLEAECPMCGRIVVVPAKSEPGTMYDAASGDDQKAADRVVSSKDAEEIDPSVLKNLTIRIDADALGLDFSADADKKAAPVDEELVSFFCPNCHQEIEASIDLAGTQAECPNCAMTFEIPFESETAPQAVERHAPGDDSQAQIQARKSKTMRIDLPDNF